MRWGRLRREVWEGAQNHRDGDRARPGRQVDPVVGHLVDLEDQVHRAVGDQGCRGSDRDQAAENTRRLLFREPLQGQRLADRLEVVEADRHQHGREVEAVLAREESGQRDPDAEHQHRDNGERLFTQDEDDEDGGKCEEARYLPQALQNADLAARERRLLDGEVVEQRLPGREPEGHRDARQD